MQQIKILDAELLANFLEEKVGDLLSIGFMLRCIDPIAALGMRMRIMGFIKRPSPPGLWIGRLS